MLHKNVQLHFCFIRHGESERNLQPELIGGRSPGVHLSTRGVAQARALGLRLRDEGFRFDRVYASSLPRAVETAEVICAELGIAAEDILRSDEIIEFSQGDWEGRPRAEVYTLENLAHISSKGSLFVPPGGESQRMVGRRAAAWIEDEILYNPEILSARMPVHIAVVTHGIVLKCLLHYIMGFDDRLTWRIQLDNCSLSRFLFKKEGWFPICINDSHHLRQVGKVPDLHTGR
jgi:broad specificity phosphatase PhoE